jgi:hypothetical protein
MLGSIVAEDEQTMNVYCRMRKWLLACGFATSFSAAVDGRINAAARRTGHLSRIKAYPSCRAESLRLPSVRTTLR